MYLWDSLESILEAKANIKVDIQKLMLKLLNY